MKKSLTLPPRARAASFTSSSRSCDTPNHRPRDRSVHSGEWRWSTLTWRSADRATPVSSALRWCSWSGCTAALVRALVAARAWPARSRTVWWRASAVRVHQPCGSSPALPLPSAGCPLPAAGSAGGAGSRSKSRNCTESRMPPSPSVIVWCRRWTMAPRPSDRPSTTTNSQSGRVRSNGWRLSVATRCSRSSMSAVPPRSTHLRWWSRSNKGSSRHSGGASRAGLGTTFWRSRGTATTARSMRARNFLRSTGRSKTVRLANAEDSCGSRSSSHMSASNSLMRPSSWGVTAAIRRG